MSKKNEISLDWGSVNLGVFQNSVVLSEDDKARVREYAKLIEEMERLEKEIKKISKIVQFLNADWCRKHIWVSLDGRARPIFDIEDSHLKNIVKYLKERGRSNSRISKEYVLRFGIDDTITEDDSFKPKDKNIYDSDFVDDF